jgi:pimeloyl-ACP methyl ester carboxylesterase
MQPVTRYAKAGDIHVAYQVFGNGPIDLVFVPGFISHIENYWTEPRFARWLDRLGSFCRVVMFDKRGTGLSDRVGALPTMDERLDDVRAVMDATGLERAAVFGISEGASLAALFAATHPERCNSLVLYGGFARFASWIPTEQALEDLFRYIDTDWGSGKSLPMFAPSHAGEATFQQWWGRFERLGANPAAAIALMRMNSQIDITDVLPSIHVPTLVIHKTEDTTVAFEGGQVLANRIPGARLVTFPGTDHIVFLDDVAERILDAMEEFLTGSRSTGLFDRVLATVLFTDIVDSTARAEAVGDRAWRDILDAHDAVVRREFAHFGGKEVKSLGDGFLATFDRPARAIRCALEIVQAVQPLGIAVRVGAHTGEIDLVEGDLRGIAVHIASRVMAFAAANEVLVSRTVKDLVAGSGLVLEDHGVHSLKGVPEDWHIYRALVTAPAAIQPRNSPSAADMRWA